MRYYVPISVQTLNTNINANLDLGAAHGIKTDWIENTSGGSPLVHRTGASRVCQAVDNLNFSIYGGQFGAEHGACIILTGSTAIGAGSFYSYVPNAAAAAGVPMFEILGITDTPFLNMLGHRITGLAQATTAMDAVPLTAIWQAWTPTLTWTGGTPAGLTTVARYCQIGRTVFFSFQTSSADSNACTNLTITLPVAFTSAMVWSCSAIERYGVAGATYAALSAYADASDDLIHFFDFRAATDAQAVAVFITGFYEV
jgi:hypothetical protein